MADSVESMARKGSTFTYLNFTQFFVTLNDSIFRLVITYSLIELLGEGESNKILAISATLFVLPFLVFSMPSGQLSDRFSKQKVIMWTLWAELIFMFYGLFAVYIKDVFSCYFALFLVALQSAILNPVKFAIIPELEPEERIAKVNGYLVLFTYLSIILGTFLASFLSDITNRNYVSVVVLCIIFSILALYTGSKIKKTPIKNPTKKVNPLFIVEVFRSLKLAGKFPHLLLAIFASSYFLLTASYTQLNLIPFGMQSLGITDVQTGYVYLAAALGVGTGSFLVSILSSKGVELGLSIWGAFGTAASYLLLFVFQHNLFLSCLMFFSVGMHGGLYVVPLDAYIQKASPEKDRGSIVASSTFISFGSVLIGAAMIGLLGDVLGVPAAVGFLIIGVCTLIAAIWVLCSIPEYLTRLFAVLVTKFFIDLQVNDPPERSLLICAKRNLLSLFTLAYSFPKIRFVKWVKKPPSRAGVFLNRIFNTLPIALTDDGKVNELGAATLKSMEEQGFSICFFCEGDGCQKVGISSNEAMKLLKHQYNAPVHQVKLESDRRENPSFFHFLHLLHVHFTLSFVPHDEE